MSGALSLRISFVGATLNEFNQCSIRALLTRILNNMACCLEFLNGNLAELMRENKTIPVFCKALRSESIEGIVFLDMQSRMNATYGNAF